MAFLYSFLQEVLESDLPSAVALLKNLQEQVSNITPLEYSNHELAFTLCALPSNFGDMGAYI